MIDELGRGGMGIVYAVRDRMLQRDLALKILSPHRDNDSFHARFIEEAQISGQLQHPGIVPIYDVGRLESDQVYFTMKQVRGRTLADALRASVPSDESAWKWIEMFEQICQAIGYAHARGVIHRDLKPSNIMLGTYGEVQVMDWGIAKVLPPAETQSSPHPGPYSPVRTIRDATNLGVTEQCDDLSSGDAEDSGSSSETEHGSVMGTVSYMSPEQASGQTEKVGRHSDVFLLGGILVEILTRNPTYVATTHQQRHLMAIRGDLKNCHDRINASPFPEELKAITCRCLSLNPADRPRDAAELATAIGELRRTREHSLREAELRSVALDARFEESKRTALAERRRQRVAIIASALATVLLLATTIGYFAIANYRSESELARSEARLSAIQNEQIQSEQLASQRQRFEAIYSLARSTLQNIETASVVPAIRQRAELANVIERLRLNASTMLATPELTRANDLIKRSQRTIELGELIDQFDLIDASLAPFGNADDSVDLPDAWLDRWREGSDAYQRLFESSLRLLLAEEPPTDAAGLATQAIPTWAGDEIVAAMQKWRAMRFWTNASPAIPPTMEPLDNQFPVDDDHREIWKAFIEQQTDRLALLMQSSASTDLPDAMVMAVAEYFIRNGSRHRCRQLQEQTDWTVLKPSSVESFNDQKPSVGPEGWIEAQHPSMHDPQHRITVQIPPSNLAMIRLETRVPADRYRGPDQKDGILQGPGVVRDGLDGCLISKISFNQQYPQPSDTQPGRSRPGKLTPIQVRAVSATHPRVRGRELTNTLDGDPTRFWSVVHNPVNSIETAIFELEPQRRFFQNLVIEIESGDSFIRENTRLGSYRLSLATQPADSLVDYERLAVTLMEQIAIARPDSRRVLMRLAEQHRYVVPNETASSLTFASAAIAADPQDAEAVRLLTQIVLDEKPSLNSTWYQRIQGHVTRLTDSQERQQLRQHIATYQIQRGDQALDQQPEVALEAYQEAIRLSPSSFNRFTQLGWKLYQNRHFDQAEQAFLSSVKQSGQSAERWEELGKFYDLRGKTLLAIDAMESSLRCQPSATTPRRRLGRLLLQAEQFADGEILLRQLDRDGLLDEMTLARSVMSLAAFEQADRVEHWAAVGLQKFDGIASKELSPNQVQAIVRILFSMAAVDRTDLVEHYLSADPDRKSLVRRGIDTSLNESLMQRSFNTEPKIENPVVAHEIYQSLYRTDVSDSSIQMRLNLLEFVLKKDATVPIASPTSLGGLVAFLRETPREQWQAVSPKIVQTYLRESSSADERSLIEWLWWEYRINDHPSQPWDGWTRDDPSS